MGRFASSLTKLLLCLAAFCPGASAADPGQKSPWYEGFEGPEVSWRPAGGNAAFRVELHQRIRGEAHTGDGCERLRLIGGNGSEVFLAHEVGRPRVIDDLLPTVWVKADRPGIQLAARVVFPRSDDPQTHRHLSAVIYGSSYSTVGRWQQLRLEEIPRLLAREVRALRARFGPGVDAREAYVGELLLNVYGGPGTTNVWIDDLDIAGYVPSPDDTREPPGTSPDRAGWVSVAPVEAAGGAAVPARAPAETPVRRRVKLGNSVLLIDDRPIFPRIIQHQGEPLGLLRQLGFNTVWLTKPPAAALLEEADRLGLWLIVAPSHGPQPARTDNGEAPRPTIGPEYDGVLAWDLGSGSDDRDLPVSKQWAEETRMADRRQPGRPVVCRPASELRAYSRCADVVVVGRPVLGSSLDLADYGAWLREQPQWMRPGVPLWTTVQTQPAPSLRQQWSAFGQGPLPAAFSGEQVQLLVYTAMAAGCRGLLFESYSPLGASDVDTRTRALTLELLNLQLDVVEPWAAAGTVVATVPGSESGVAAAVFQAEHGRLVVPAWSAPGAQYVSGQAAGAGVALVVPGVPESYNAYLIAPGGLRPLRHKRQTGGVRVAIDELDLTSMILLTENPLVVSSMSRRVVQASRRWVELQRELAALKLRAVASVLGQLPTGLRLPNEAELLGSAQKNLAQCDALLGSRDESAAYVQAVRALRGLRVLERAAWEAGVASCGSPVSSPGAVALATLPRHAALMERAARSRPGANLVPAGDFEDFGVMSEAGWRHLQHPAPGLESSAELAPMAAHSGRLGLRIAARATDPKATPLMVESPPAWIATPPVRVEAGQVLLLHGWVQVPRPIAASVDGLLIVDSLGGEPLALRVRHTAGWQEFRLYRAASEPGPVTLTFAMTGIGEAWIDDVTIQPLP